MKDIKQIAKENGFVFGSTNYFGKEIHPAHFTTENWKAFTKAILASEQEPFAYYVYVEEFNNGYYVDDLDDAQCVDDCTNHYATVQPLYLHPSQDKATSAQVP